MDESAVPRRLTVYESPMASLYTLAFSRRVVLGRTTFCHDLIRARRTLWKAPVGPTLLGTSRPLSNAVASRRIGVTVRKWTGASLVGTGLGLLSYANLRGLNCECKSVTLWTTQISLRLA